jgi:cytochrome c peroxidase
MSKQLKAISGGLAMILGGCGGPEGGQSEEVGATEQALVAGQNSAGVAETVHTSGSIDRGNPFFAALGTNLRTCETCHIADQGWTMTAEAVTRLFKDSDGLAPLFMVHDTGGRPDADISTRHLRKLDFKPTMERGLVRFTRNISPTAQFAVTAVADPYGFSTLTQVSSFRRPSPTANESKVPNTGWAGAPAAPVVSVASTTSAATRGHEQRVDVLPPATVNAMRDFQLGVVFAQIIDNEAGRLDSDGARGGAANLLAQPFYEGINDLQGNDPMGHPYTRKVFDLFDAWAIYDDGCHHGKQAEARAAIYRGQELFNSYEFDITGVAGLNDLLGQPTVRGTCSTCHNAPNVGSHAVYRMFDVGTADEPNCGDVLPLVTLQNKTTLATRKTCDMGRATGTGLWADIGKFRAPPLRGLVARAPYFHDGQARDIKAVVKYFDERFTMRLKGHQKRDLEAFLGAL